MPSCQLAGSLECCRQSTLEFWLPLSTYKWTTGLPTWTVLKRLNQWSIISMIWYMAIIAAKRICRYRVQRRSRKRLAGSYQATPFGWTTPGWNYYWGWSPAANAWMMQNVYDYYKFTKDETYLKKRFIQCSKAAKFWTLLAPTRPVTVGFLLHLTRQSTELSIGNTFDQSLVWQLFHDYMEA